MELEKVLHMKGGNEDTSYAQTAYVAVCFLPSSVSVLLMYLFLVSF